ncbi:hypothetical protein [Leptospira barantonii]|uniref:hypothetical protein n=1 Tax=Leptospira barantonii TaxID=2023184 RepID=UPI001AEF7DCD|nr:hypothetical protein [Leptospira barantonii]
MEANTLSQGKYRPGPIEGMKILRSKKDLLSKIAQLDMNNVARGLEGCTATNKDIGSYVDLAETTVAKYIREFCREGLLIRVKLIGPYRVLKICDELRSAILKEKQRNLERYGSKNTQDSNPSNEHKDRNSGRGNLGRSSQNTPYHESPPCTSSLVTSVPTYVQSERLAFNHESKEWNSFIKYGKEKLTNSSNQILRNLRVHFEGETLTLSERVSDSLFNIISKYFNEILKIETKIIMPTEENKEKREPEFIDSKENNQKEIKSDPPLKYFRDFISYDRTIKDFINYAEFKLEKKDLDLLREAKIHYNLEQLIIYERFKDNLKNFIRNYFYNILKNKDVVAVRFVEKVEPVGEKEKGNTQVSLLAA